MAIPTRYPDAVWRPPPGMYVGPVRQKTDLVIWHVDAGNANSLYGWWNQAGSGQNGSHFFVKTDGTVEQYAPIDRITWTSGNGSIRSVGIETQGYAAGEWTPAQRAALIKLTRWLCKTLGVPMVMAPNSKLTSRGIAWHRQGVPATQAQKAAKVSQTGGELWSSSVGKVCPGPDREKQIPHMVGEIANQSIIDPGKPGPEEDEDMPLNADTDYAAFSTMLQRALRFDVRPGGVGANWQLGPTLWERFSISDSNTAAVVSAIVPVIVNQVVEKIPTSQPVDVSKLTEEVTQATTEAVDRALSNIEITLSNNGGKDA